MGKVCSCIDRNYRPNYNDINLSVINKCKEEPTICKAVISDNLLVKNYQTEDLSQYIPLVEKIQRIFYRWKFYKKERQLLIEAKEKIFSEVVEKFMTENLKKAESKFGEFKRDKISREKRGKLFFTHVFLKKNDTEMYSGQIDIHNNRTGYGFLIDKNGCKYIGDWFNDKFNGFGRFIDIEGNIHEGIFENNLLKEGKYETLSGKYLYKGSWLNGKKHGYGKEETNEIEYIGEFIDDLKHGKGKINLKFQEEKYEGEFSNGEITGNGTYYWKNGNTYIGEFLKGKIHGKGLYKWNDGGEYEGSYDHGVKQGYGRYKMKDGSIFVGPFENGQPHGIGVLTYKGKEIKNVEFLEGKLKEKRKAK